MTGRPCPTCGTLLPADAPESLCPRCLLRVAMESPPAQAAALAAPAPAVLAPHFPHLEILGLIGQGGMGAVYKARQVKLDRPVALKILPRQADSDPAFAERFVREARALARLQHPHIVAVHDFGEAGGYYYLLMEYVDGTNLRQTMRPGPVAPQRVVKIVSALADALQYAHRREIVHRDLKPENVLIDQQGHVKLADFGLAKLVSFDPASLTLTGANQAMGTPHYMAPEQLERPREVDHRADIYSLGVLTYEMLTGELPLGRFDPPSKRSSVHPELDEIVMKALERDPARRYQAAGEMLAALRSVGEPSVTAKPKAAAAASAPPLDEANEALVMGGLALGVAGVLAGIVLARSGWFAFGMLAVERLANSIAWRPERRALVGVLLALGGIACSIVILVFVPSMWWMIFVVWFWYGDHVYKFFKGINPHEPGAEVAESTQGWSGLAAQQQAMLKALHGADEEGLITNPSDLDGEQLAKLREANEVLPDERVLAVVRLDDDQETTAVIFGSQHIYFPATQRGEAIRCSLSYESLAGRQFVNHGTGVYAGDGITLKPEMEVNCEALAALLNAAAHAVQATAGATPSRPEVKS